MKHPLLATEADFKTVKFPVFASAKLDGIRGIVESGVIYSRSGKPIKNLHVQKYFAAHPELNGLDGELIVGDPNAKDVFLQTTSGVMSIKGEPDFSYYVFDSVANPEMPYKQRHATYVAGYANDRVVVLEQKLLKNEAEVRAYEELVCSLGYEGLIIRSPDAPYKFGRSSSKEGILLKVKRFKDAEAVVLDTVELLSNQNEAKEDVFGHTERSSEKAGMVPMGVLGSLNVKDVKTGQVFNIGTGFDAAQRASYWKQRAKLKGKICRYKFFEVGVKDLPRFPVFTGFRDKSDLS